MVYYTRCRVYCSPRPTAADHYLAPKVPVASQRRSVSRSVPRPWLVLSAALVDFACSTRQVSVGRLDAVHVRVRVQPLLTHGPRRSESPGLASQCPSVPGAQPSTLALRPARASVGPPDSTPSGSSYAMYPIMDFTSWAAATTRECPRETCIVRRGRRRSGCGDGNGNGDGDGEGERNKPAFADGGP